MRRVVQNFPSPEATVSSCAVAVFPFSSDRGENGRICLLAVLFTLKRSRSTFLEVRCESFQISDVNRKSQDKNYRGNREPWVKCGINCCCVGAA